MLDYFSIRYRSFDYFCIMNKILLPYLIAINVLAFAIYGLDKAFSKQKGSRRVPERSLLWLARLGGGFGCWLGMTVFRHKTKHAQFKVLVPLWTVAWGILLLFLFVF